MNIGNAVKATGVSAKMIRYYESIGLIGPVPRRDNGYREYADNEIHLLRFIGKSRELGFPVSHIQSLIALWQDQSRASSDVRNLAISHIEELNERISSLRAMVQTLERLTLSCQGDQRPDCPILDELASSAGPSKSAA